MSITAKVIADSVGKFAPRLTTLEIEYPRFVHAEFMTHRVFSRNASSSRAIPLKRMHEKLHENPALPAEFRMNQPGMQGYEVASPEVEEKAREIIARHRAASIDCAEELAALGLHKQHFNRYTEPHQHIKVVLTATAFDNWDWLRIHHAADPTIGALAKAVYEARQASEPQFLNPGEWHLPYIRTPEIEAALEYISTRDETLNEVLLKMSGARCARVSYNNFDGLPPSIDSDLGLYEKLIKREPDRYDPQHASPVEHQATPDRYLERTMAWDQPALHGNFNGWVQHRKLIPGETMEGVPWQPQS